MVPALLFKLQTTCNAAARASCRRAAALLSDLPLLQALLPLLSRQVRRLTQGAAAPRCSSCVLMVCASS